PKNPVSLSADKYDAVSVLHSNTAVCQGYAQLFAALARAAGVPTKVVEGNAISASFVSTGINHSWNEVYVGGQWKSIDTTWDAGYLNSKDKFVSEYQTKYYEPRAADFAQDHTW